MQFNAATSNQEDTKKLVCSINNALDSPLGQNTLDEAFDMWWPKLAELMGNLPTDYSDVVPDRPDRDILEELLDLTRLHNKQLNSLVFHMGSIDDAQVDGESRTGVTGIAAGAHVRHEKFGKGLVLRREGSGDNVKLTISFPGFGQKRMIEKFAKLSVL